MNTASALILALTAAGLGAAGAWFGRQGEVDAHKMQAENLGRKLTRAERDAGEFRAYADAERRRVEPLEARIEELKLQLRVGTPPATIAARDTEPGAAPPATDPGRRPSDPALWDESTYRRQIDRLAAEPAKARRHLGWPLVFEALTLRGDDGRDFLVSLLASGVEARHKTVAAMLLEDLGDPAAAEPIRTVYVALPADADVLYRNTLLNALAVLPGDASTELFVAAWNDSKEKDPRRRAGLRGLGLRGHDIAHRVARGEEEGVGKVMRYVAMGTLKVRDQKGGYQDAKTLETFEIGIASVNGERQISVLIEALEGHWSKTSVEPLLVFARGSFGTVQQRARAKIMSDTIKAGKPKPVPSEGRADPPGGKR